MSRTFRYENQGVRWKTYLIHDSLAKSRQISTFRLALSLWGLSLIGHPRQTAQNSSALQFRVWDVPVSVFASWIHLENDLFFKKDLTREVLRIFDLKLGVTSTYADFEWFRSFSWKTFSVTIPRRVVFALTVVGPHTGV